MIYRGKSSERAESSLDFVFDDTRPRRPRGMRLPVSWLRFLGGLSSSLALDRLRRIWFHQSRVSRHSQSQHLDEVQMLAYLDGELPPFQSQAASSHLQGCWSCRSESRLIRKRIKSFLAGRQAHMPESFRNSAERVGELRRLLTQSVK